MGRSKRLQSYQPLGDLHLIFEKHVHPEGYVRNLDLNTASIHEMHSSIGDIKRG